MSPISIPQRARATRLVMDAIRREPELMNRIRSLLAIRCDMPMQEADHLVLALEHDGLLTWSKNMVTLTDLGIDWLEDRA